MSNIGTVIGWKFDNQEHMVTREGVITEFPGGIPSQADQDKWTAEYLVEFPEGFDEWKETIQATDAEMPRYLEDLITDNPTLTINEYTQVKYDAKIELRATKP